MRDGRCHGHPFSMRKPTCYFYSLLRAYPPGNSSSLAIFASYVNRIDWGRAAKEGPYPEWSQHCLNLDTKQGFFFRCTFVKSLSLKVRNMFFPDKFLLLVSTQRINISIHLHRIFGHLPDLLKIHATLGAISRKAF